MGQGHQNWSFCCCWQVSKTKKRLTKVIKQRTEQLVTTMSCSMALMCCLKSEWKSWAMMVGLKFFSIWPLSCSTNSPLSSMKFHLSTCKPTQANTLLNLTSQGCGWGNGQCVYGILWQVGVWSVMAGGGVECYGKWMAGGSMLLWLAGAWGVMAGGV